MLPPPTAIDATNSAATRIGTQSDTSWAGWAISSFTNKMTAAKGEMQPSINGTTANRPEEPRSSSVPPPRQTGTPVAAAQKAQVRSSTPQITSSAEEQSTFFGEAEAETEDVYDAWGTMDDEDDSFFDAPATKKDQTPAPAKSNPFDDGGEPDFAGWLAAQSQAKSKKPLPKGLSKPAKETNTRPTAARPTTTGSVGSGVGAKKLATTSTVKPKVPTASKKIDTAPKGEDAEDGWGDTWD